MTVGPGRRLAIFAIAIASDMRRYAETLDRLSDDHAVTEPELLSMRVRRLARELEELSPQIVEFEGDQRPQLEADQARHPEGW